MKLILKKQIQKKKIKKAVEDSKFKKLEKTMDQINRKIVYLDASGNILNTEKN